MEFWTRPRADVDRIAEHLLFLGTLGRSLPPAWDGARIAHLVSGPQGEFVGKLLPGRGLLLYDDLKHYGITTPLPCVFEKSLAFRLRDLLTSERGAITTYAGLLAARTARKHGFDAAYGKSVGGISARWSSSFTGTGMPAAGAYTAIPGGAALNQTSTGALNYGFAQPTNPDKAFLLSLGLAVNAVQLTCGCLVDLLVGAGNIDSNSAAAQTVNTTALTRYTSGAGVLVFVETTATHGSTAANLTINKYTNQAGTTLQATAANAMVTTSAAPQLSYTTSLPFFGLAAGDYGVRSVEEVTFSAAMGGTGKVAVVLCMPLVWIPSIAAGLYGKRPDLNNVNGAVQLAQTSGDLMGCLSLLLRFGASGTMGVNGDIEIAVGN